MRDERDDESPASTAVPLENQSENDNLNNKTINENSNIVDKCINKNIQENQPNLENVSNVDNKKLHGRLKDVSGKSKIKISKHEMKSIGSVICRICHNAENPERLISPCLCKGTLAFVHKHCLEHWLSTSGMTRCELCHFQFETHQSLRYSLLQSVRLWYSHPNNRGLLQTDFIICSMLTVVSFGLMGIAIMASHYFFLQRKRIGISHLWTQFSILLILFLISIVYCINMFLVLKSQLLPWYRWWQSAKIITLILENRKSIYSAAGMKNASVDEIVVHLNQPSEQINFQGNQRNQIVTSI